MTPGLNSSRTPHVVENMDVEAAAASGSGSPATQIEVLGPIRVWQGVEEQRIPTAKPRSLLALLLAQHDRPVSLEEIIGVIWPDRVPASAVNLVQKYVGQLRRQFVNTSGASSSEPALSLEPGGYRLRMRSECVDLLRFRRAVANAVDDDEESLNALLSALELWRGQSFGGLPSSVRGHPIFEAVDSEYFNALMRTARSAASLGRLHRVLPALQRAVVWRPLDETVHAWWILSLAAAGRQAEAVAGYESIRQRLVEELGIDPGPELRDAQHQVLRQVDRPSTIGQFTAVNTGKSSRDPRGMGAGVLLAQYRHRLPSSDSIQQARSWAAARQQETSSPAAAISCAQQPSTVSLMSQTDLYGREDSVEELMRRVIVGDRRMLTITGISGVGKTRLAAEVARRLSGTFAQLFWVSMAGVQRADFVLDAVGAAAAAPTEKIVDLRERFTGQPTLLVLDNLEHLNTVRTVLNDLLAACPEVRILATSRRPTSTLGEQEWPLVPLRTPRPSECDPAAIGQVPSVRLFVARLRAIRPAFELSAQNAVAVGQLCRQLDGLPLAIELAAAQCRAFEPIDLLRRNGELLQRLPAAAGHPSLRAALQSSYELLDAEAQRLLRLLASFRGGWSLDAAAAVCGDAIDALAGLNNLIGHGMILSRIVESESRCEMLETIRRYVRARDTSLGDLPERLHARYFLELAERLAPLMKTDEAGQALTQLEIERDNIRQATGFFAGNDPVGGLRLAVALYRYWLLRGRNDEGVRTFADLLGRPEPQLGDARLAARSQLLAANLALFGGDVPAAEAFANAGLSSYRLLGDPDGLAASHTTLSMLARQRGDRGEARRQGVEAVASAERSSDSPLLVVCLNNLAAALQDMGELDEAERLCHRTLALARKAGERLAEAIATHNLADNARLRGDLRLADRFCGRTVRLRIRTGDLPGLANSEATWAVVKAGLGDLISAERLVDDALQHAEMGKVPYGRGAALWARAELNLTTNRPAAAEFGRAIDDLLRVGDHATCLEALSGLAIAAESADVAQRARTAAQFVQRTYSLYLPVHVRRRLEHPAGSPAGVPPDEFTAAELEELLVELRQIAYCSA